MTVRSLAFSRDGRLVAALPLDQGVSAWDVPTGKIIAEFNDHDGPVMFLDFCRDGKTLAGCDGLGVPLDAADRPGGPGGCWPGGVTGRASASRPTAGCWRRPPDQPVAIWDLSPA